MDPLYNFFYKSGILHENLITKINQEATSSKNLSAIHIVMAQSLSRVIIADFNLTCFIICLFFHHLYGDTKK